MPPPSRRSSKAFCVQRKAQSVYACISRPVLDAVKLRRAASISCCTARLTSSSAHRIYLTLFERLLNIIKASSIRGIHSRHVQPLDLTVPTKPPYAQAVSASVVFACMPHVACCVCWLDTPPLRFGLSSVYSFPHETWANDI